ncbi:hypothetical protein BU17DRAFT_85977 [Hysterangium stoloniferum]|nr:hypothetical protein BU17DRAFT_85977 [Hysterangium stoloniferum]
MTDTPTKGSPTCQPQYMNKMNYNVCRATDDDLNNYYHVEDKNKFLSHLVPISDELLSKILHILVCNKTYQDGMWKGFLKQSGGKENRIAVNALGGMVQVKVQGQWRDVHSRAPDLKNPTSAALQPDALNKMEKVQLAKVWWLQVFTIIEMKTTSAKEDIEEALK